MYRLTVLFAAMTIAVGACGLTDSSTNISGDWVGIGDAAGVEVTLVDNSGVITGSGTLVVIGSANYAISVTGASTGSSVSLTLTSGLHPPVNFQGTITNSTTITGALSGSGFNGDPLTLLKGPS